MKGRVTVNRGVFKKIKVQIDSEVLFHCKKKKYRYVQVRKETKLCSVRKAVSDVYRMLPSM